MSNTPSILTALSILNKPSSTNTSEIHQAILPTAKSREYLNKLFMSRPQDFADGDVKALLQNILNWNGNNKVNKPLMKIFRELIVQPETFSQTVEFTGFAAAIAPLLEADHLTQLYEQCVPQTITSFAPTLYTINFNKNINKVFTPLSTTRIVKIAASLWLESHHGRWWNMTAGVENVQQQQRYIEPKELLQSIKEYKTNTNMENIIWSEENQKEFSEYMNKHLDKDIAKISETFRIDLMEGNPVTPDIAIFLSAIKWLSPTQRPESPINSLLRSLAKYKEIEEKEGHSMEIKKPNSIKEMFPNLCLANDEISKFPFDRNVVAMEANNRLLQGTKENIQDFYLINNPSKLAKNASHMGNCTLTYQKNMEEGRYALFYIKTDKNEYNVSLILNRYNNDNKWKIGEINSIRNSGNVPIELRNTITNNINKIPKPDQEYFEYIEHFTKKNKEKSYTYEYII